MPTVRFQRSNAGPFEIKSSQSAGLKSCDVNFWRKVRLSLVDFKELAPNYEVAKRLTERISLSIGPVNRVCDSLSRKNNGNSFAQPNSECYKRVKS